MNKVDITFVLDRSGSMQNMAVEANNAMNRYVEDRKKDGVQTTFSLVQFDDEYEIVYNGVPVENVGTIALVPRGSTALLDAIGKAINATGSRLAAISESDRPNKVLFVILTDGGENASREFKNNQIKAMIQEQTDKYSWSFVYLGAHQDSFAVAGAFGIHVGNTANYVGVGSGILRAMNMVSQNTSIYSCSSNDKTTDFFQGNENV